MTVPSATFLLFAAVAAVLFNLVRNRWWRDGVLLAANLVFLASFVLDPATLRGGADQILARGLELVPYAGFLALGFVLVRWLQAGASTRLHVAAIGLVLAAFFWLKKYTFLPSQLFLTAPYTVIGLSYVFFRVLHLVIDAKDPAALARVGPLTYLNYTLNFTSLVSGPIQRYDDYHRQTTREPAPLDLIAVGEAVQRIVVGLFKVMVVSLALSSAQKHLVAQVMSDEALGLRIVHGCLLAALYPVYLYFNFSGYTDFVIGVGRFFRIKLPENFNRPFSSTSFIEYWSRWHMTLSDWLKTYVYNPLLMVLMRRVRHPAIAPFLGVFALFVTFFLIGAWHGRTSVFLFFGVLNGLGVAANQYYRIVITRRMGRKGYSTLSRNPLYAAVCRGLTFTWLAFSLLWFFSDWREIGALATALGPLGVPVVWLAMLVGASLVLAAMEAARSVLFEPKFEAGPLILSRYVRTVWVTVLAAATVGVQTVMNAPAPDIVYKAF
jgi:D-alanyl-lipoteichoic acid acyltransferase DltB (MBOAT superfamily)